MKADHKDEIADRGEAPREQAGSAADYRKMYERASALAKIGVWEFDLRHEIMRWTDGVYDLFGLVRGSALDRARILDMYYPASRREMEQLRQRAIDEGIGFAVDIRITTAQGEPKWLRLTADIEQEDGRPARIFGTKQDISAEKAAEQTVKSLQAELVQSSRRSAMGAMAATLAHELNQPLSAITNYAAGTRRALSQAEPPLSLIEDGLDAIHTSALRAARIIRTMRAMTDGAESTRSRVEIEPLIREAAALAGRDSRTALCFDLTAGAAVAADPVQIQQVLINLIRNAHEAMSGNPAGCIAISSRIGSGAVTIKIEDEGPGIAPEQLGGLFDTQPSAKPGGMGIGLSVSRTIVEAHEGSIEAANRPGGGACFTVRLPLTAG